MQEGLHSHKKDICFAKRTSRIHYHDESALYDPTMVFFIACGGELR